MNVMQAESAATTAYPGREGRRQVALHGWLIRPGTERAHDFSIDNLSYGGCRLQSSAQLALGDKVDINVHHRGTIPGTVRWLNAYGIGISFAAETLEKIEKPRKGTRLSLDGELTVRQAARRARSIPANDLSRFGCCVDFEEQPFEGERVWVTLPGLTALEARVKWKEGLRAGLEFAHPVHESVFNLTLLRLGIAA